MALIPCKVVSLLALLCSLPALAQTAQPSPPEAQLNVVVHGHEGHAITGLTTADFHLTLNGQPLTITRVEEHTAATPPEPIRPVNLTPGTFADFTAIPPSSTLNILVLDSLNTPPEAQATLRTQLQHFAERAAPTGHLAIFGLTTHLILLQDFTTGPTVLKDAVEHQLIPRGEALLDTTHDLASAATAEHDLQLMQIAANLHEFESGMKSDNPQFRQQYTLDALHSLAVYLASLPGRKNVLWLATSFPVTLAPQPTANPELTQTDALLNAAGATLYPIDARSLLTPQPASHAIKFQDSADAEHTAMQQLASSTGGSAILNATSLLDAVTQATQLGAAYYTLTCPLAATTASPAIQVTLTGPAAANAMLIYPHGAPVKTDQLDGLRAAMARGAPAPQEIPFKVRVLPASTAPEPTIAPGNQQDPSYKIPGPWQRYEIDFAALAADFSLATAPNGQHTGKIEALAYVYDIDGRILNTDGKTISITLTPAQYARFRNSVLSLHVEISVPLRQQSYLRLSLRDTDSGRIGVVEIPVSAVSHLPPIAEHPGPSHPPAATH
ncbi:VWA domain-containing protein [Granulicella sp. 5B5]|uniref:VWA domain-containing protein n=1 Tax=Granulicella sp. 5B5 TaxID=1617967 RepID=UPI0015F4F8D3|nr:VWA domain-containing protein [Granulicella sp. 5B5]